MILKCMGSILGTSTVYSFIICSVNGTKLLSCTTSGYINDSIYDELIKRSTRFLLGDSKERRLMEASLAIRKRYGKNALLKGVNFDEGATGRERNSQIGGHRK